MRPVPRGVVLVSILTGLFMLAGGFLYLDSRIDGIKPQQPSVVTVTEVAPREAILPTLIRPGMIQVDTPRSASSSVLPTVKTEQSSLIPTSTTTSPVISVPPPASSSAEATPPVVVSTVDAPTSTNGDTPASPETADAPQP